MAGLIPRGNRGRSSGYGGMGTGGGRINARGRSRGMSTLAARQNVSGADAYPGGASGGPPPPAPAPPGGGAGVAGGARPGGRGATSVAPTGPAAPAPGGGGGGPSGGRGGGSRIATSVAPTGGGGGGGGGGRRGNPCGAY